MRIWTLTIASVLLLACGEAFAQTARLSDLNTDESKVPAYTLPELLRLENGRRVKNVRIWEKRRRPELLGIFARQEYGVMPDFKPDLSIELVESGPAFGGKAMRKQIDLVFRANGQERKVRLLEYIPLSCKGPCPCFVGLNFKGNTATTSDSCVLAGEHDFGGRAANARRWPFEQIIESGYAVVTAHYYDFYPDREDAPDSEKFAGSMLPLFGYSSISDMPADGPGAISVWAWGYSRILDYLIREEPLIDGTKVVSVGHSRLGKTSLWAGAQDPRFAIVIANDSGCCGAALSKRCFGENLNRVMRFGTWFCKDFYKYSDRESELPFDQHELLALIAPRPLYVASAEDDIWSDPKGEYLSALEAGKVYPLYGKQGLSQDASGMVGYHMRKGGHDIIAEDWTHFIIFADRFLK